MQRQIVVKLSHPRAVYGYEGIGARGQSPGNLGVWEDYTFEINNDVDECDYWVVIESVPARETARVPAGNVIFVQGEPEYVRSYSPQYLSQFDRIVTWRDDIPGDNIIHSYCLDGWWIRRTYDQIKSDVITKTATMSVVASDKAALPEHRKRFAFINRMIGHFKDRLAVYGSVAGTYCDDKYGALAPYEYSIAIEAAQFPDYWTEKIADCYLCETMPLYFGCPNITDYFPSESLTPIDIDDYKASIRTIEEAIEGNAYQRHRKKIIEAKHKILDELQVYPHIVRLLESIGDRSPHPRQQRRVELTPATKLMQEDVTAGWQRELMV